MSKLQRLSPDERLIKQVNEILAQNRLIIEMNFELAKAIMMPPVVYSGSPMDFEKLEPGRILRREKP